MWLLEKVINGLKTLVQTIFPSVLDFVVGVAAVPILGPINALLDICLTIVCGVADVIVNGVLNIMAFDQFGSVTLFEVAFPTNDYYSVLKAFSFSLLAVIFLFQIVRTIVSTPDSNSDDPAGLAVRTFIAGILIASSQSLIRFAYRFFGYVYQAIGTGGTYQISFSEMSDAAQKFMKDDLIIGGIRAQTLTLLAMTLLLAMCFALAKRIISYVIELVLRFTIVGVMLITAPLAATLYVSKSTRNSFQSWIRMIGSQLILLVFGIFFMRLFCDAFNGFSATFSLLRTEYSVNRFTTLLVWTFMVCAILLVGTKVDSFLKTLGLSAAECGSNMSMAMMSEALNIVAGAGAVVALGTAVATGVYQPGPVMNAMSSAVGGVANATGRAIRSVRKPKNVVDGIAPITVDEINRAVPPVVLQSTPAGKPKQMQHTSFKLGGDAGKNLCGAMRGIPANLRNRIDETGFSIRNGAIEGSTYAGKDGARTSFICIPVESDKNRQTFDMPLKKTEDGKPYIKMARPEDLPEGGRDVMIGGQMYRMYATGSGAREMMVSNPQAKKAMRQLGEETGNEVFEVKDKEGNATGIWQQLIYNPDGSLTKRNWAPMTRYHVDDSMGAMPVEIGGMLYAQYDVDYGFSPLTGSELPEPVGFDDWPDNEKEEWFKQCFPVYKDKKVENINWEKKVFAADIDGTRVLTFSSLEYGLRNGRVNSSDVRIIRSAAGAQYTSVTLHDQDAEKPADAIWDKRGVTGAERDVSGMPLYNDDFDMIVAAQGQNNVAGAYELVSQSDGRQILDGDKEAQKQMPETEDKPTAKAEGDTVTTSGQTEKQKPVAKKQTGLTDREWSFLFSREPEELVPTEIEVESLQLDEENVASSDDETSDYDINDDEPKRERRRKKKGHKVVVVDDESGTAPSTIRITAQNKVRHRKP